MWYHFIHVFSDTIVRKGVKQLISDLYLIQCWILLTTVSVAKIETVF